MDDITVTTTKTNKTGKSPQTLHTKFKRGLKIGCVNVCGLVSNPDKRVALNHWIELNDLDVICIQEWFVPHSRQTEHERKCNQISLDDSNINDNDYVSSNDSASEYMPDKFENEKRNDQRYLDVKLDMSAFPKYLKIETNSKTIILYRIGLSIIDLGNIDPISQTGLDVTWIGIESSRDVIIIGNVYHSPSYECEYDDILFQLNHVKNITNKYKHQTVIMAGDFNAKNELWGSTITDNRGIQLDEWLTTQRVTFVNDGTYTHIRKGKKEVLDVMAISQSEMNNVKKWFVQDIPFLDYYNQITGKKKKKNKNKNSQNDNLDEERFSDHRGLVMILNMDVKIKVKPNRIT